MAKQGQNLKPMEHPWIEQLSGEGQGRFVEMVDNRLTIGRSDENHLVIPTEAISRVHAIIEREADGRFVVFDNQSKNGIKVNGRKVTESVLEDGDIVQVGPIEFRFSEGQPVGGDLDLVLSDTPAKKGGMDPETIRRVIIYGSVIAFGAYFYLNQDSSEVKPEAKEKQEQGAKKKIEVAAAPETPAPKPEEAIKGLEDPTLDPLEKEMGALPWNDSGITESEAYFRKGQRDYSNRDYQRAINSFELALSLNPNHSAARYYLQGAMHSAEREAQEQYEMGAKYFEALQYQRAIYHFQRTMDLLAHRPKDPVIKEAEKYIRLAKQRLQASELFP